MGSNKTRRDLPCLAHLSVKLHITLLLNLTGFQQNAVCEPTGVFLHCALIFKNYASFNDR